jgi:hypothetical protein
MASILAAIAVDSLAVLRYKPLGKWFKWTLPQDTGLKIIAVSIWCLLWTTSQEPSWQQDFFDSDSAYNNMLVLREAIER